MKKGALLTLMCLFAMLALNAQNFTQSLKVTNAHGRDYYVNREIAGATVDGTGWNYILLHRATEGTPLSDHYVMGKITAIRGNEGAWNRKWTVEVNTAAAYHETRGTLVAYNETARLVTLTHGGMRYLAAEIGISSMMTGISFTGFARYESLTLVGGQDVTDVQVFSSEADDITLNGKAIVKSHSPYGNLIVMGPGADVNAGDDRLLSSGLVVWGNTPPRHGTIGAQLEFALPAGNGGTDHWWGHGRIITLAGNATSGSAAGKMILGTRRWFDKLQNGSTQWYYGDDIVIDAAGNVGIGTLNPQAKLAVKGEMFAQKVKVTLSGWADFVFQPEYKLPSIYEVERFIKENKRLPDVPSEVEVKEKGIDVGEMNKLLLQKVEEQMLYIIELKKEVDALKKGLEASKHNKD